MIKTTYICDRCKIESDKLTNWLWVGACFYAAEGYYSHSSYNVPQADMREKQLWCRDCCDVLQLGRYVEPKTPAVAPPAPSVEDMLREIIREEIRNVVS